APWVPRHEHEASSIAGRWPNSTRQPTLMIFAGPGSGTGSEFMHPSGSTANRSTDSRPRSTDGHGESLMGSTADSWEVADTRHPGLRTHGVASVETAHASALADLENFPDESPRLRRSDGFLHRAHSHRPGPFRARRVVALPLAHRALQCHGASDSVYSESFQQRVVGLGIAEVVSAPASPWQNPYVERLIGTIRRECLDHMIVLNARPSATRPHDLQPVLSSKPDASWAGERRSRQPADLTTIRWIDHRDSRSRRTASPLRTAGRASGLDLPRAWRSGTVGAPIAQLVSSTAWSCRPRNAT